MTFISPCILPLIPAYITFITGYSLDELKHKKGSYKHTVSNALFFILGFTVIFTLLGASATYIGNFLGMKINILRWIGGIIVIILGLHLIGIIRIKFLFREKRFHIKKQSIGYFSSFLFGLVFAIGWTPCIGPILASILVLASTQETVYQGTTLLIIFSLGLGIPFLLTAMAINLSLKIFTKIKKFYRVIEIVSGCILIVVGILIITNNFQRITAYLLS